jgi:hypothetical protein
MQAFSGKSTFPIGGRLWETNGGVDACVTREMAATKSLL